jgi:hypothetical protein
VTFGRENRMMCSDAVAKNQRCMQGRLSLEASHGSGLLGASSILI